MLLGRLEKIMMNNPVRAIIHRHVEARMLFSMGGGLQPEGHALELGCGQGVGAQIIFDVFGAGRVDAFDLDPHMVELAAKRLEPYGKNARVFVGDATKINAPDNFYDAVFDFGILHHVPDWRASLKEIFRVLKPAGRFYTEEIYERLIINPIWRRLLVHPQEDRFDHNTYNNGLRQAGFDLVKSKNVRWFGWHVADKLRYE